LHVAATNYVIPPYNWNYCYPGSPIRFAADGAGSLLDLSAIQTIQVYGVYYGFDPTTGNFHWNWDFTANASNQGVIDLSTLQAIYGADPNFNSSGSTWLSFNARSGGIIRFGNVSAYQLARFSATDPNSMLDLAGLYLRPPGTLTLGASTVLRIRGDLRFENTDTTTITADLATLLMDGAAPQQLEAGGRDVGPASTFAQGNFGFGQLVVGNTNRQSFVRLVDTLNNGGRGAAGEPESLYLYGLGGQGLRLFSGSRLLLGNINCYALVNGLSVNLRSLIPAGTNSVAFDGGFIGNFGGPSITNMTPSAVVTLTGSSVDISFNIPIQASSFTTGDVRITGPAGPITPTGLALVSGTTWRISFPAQTADGTYTVSVGPNINELAGNFLGMDQNGDGLSGDGTNDTFTGTFAIDGSAPAMVNAYALQNGNLVGLTFNETVVPAFATNAANYNVNGVAPAQAALQTNGNQVVLSVSPLAGDTFALAVSNAMDVLGNRANRSYAGTILSFQARDIGNPGSDPRDTGSTVPFAVGDFNSVGGGSSLWGSSDACHFVSASRSGDFDVRVQIPRLDRAGSYAEGGIMLRETLLGNSAKLQAIIQKASSGQYFYLGVRASTGATVTYPTGVIATDNWIRLRRQGNIFTGFRSTNGVDWIQYAALTNSLPVSGYLGLVTCSDDNNAGHAATAWYRNYSDFATSILTQPQSQTVASGANVTFGVTAGGQPALAYQWYFNGLSVSGGTSSLLALNSVAVTSVGDYRCIVTNSYGSTTSLVATLIVDGVGTGGFEADIMPEPNGDNAATISDWVKVGRLVAGLDTVLNSSEFQRADCAPRMVGTNLTLGDDRLSVADWTQAGRYAAGLDALTPAGGPTQPVVGSQAKPLDITPKIVGRKLTVSSLTAWQGAEIEVPVLLSGAEGNENALGFSLTFDPKRLAYLGATLGKDATGAWLMPNAVRANEGVIGLPLALPVGQSLGSGLLEMARVRFAVVGAAGSTGLQLADAPVVCELVDAGANPLAMALTSGAVQVVPQPGFSSLQLLPGGGLQLHLSGLAGQTCWLQVSTDLVDWVTLSTNVLGNTPLPVVDATAPGGRCRFYRLTPAQ
jgi:hypothetical protein